MEPCQDWRTGKYLHGTRLDRLSTFLFRDSFTWVGDVCWRRSFVIISLSSRRVLSSGTVIRSTLPSAVLILNRVMVTAALTCVEEFVQVVLAASES